MLKDIQPCTPSYVSPIPARFNAKPRYHMQSQWYLMAATEGIPSKSPT
jgi:hypothetical protein